MEVGKLTIPQTQTEMDRVMAQGPEAVSMLTSLGQGAVRKRTLVPTKVIDKGTTTVQTSRRKPRGSTPANAMRWLMKVLEASVRMMNNFAP